MTSEAASARKHLGPYELLRPIAQGGMADIYLATRRGGADQFAVKVLNKTRAPEAESCAMFLDEARLCSLLSHENLAAVVDVAVDDGQHYLVMEYVHGADLRELLSAASRAGRTVPFEVSLSIVAAAAAGLDHAHRRCDEAGHPLRIVHRDVSLSNLMVGHDGHVKVVDFGIASTALQTVHTSPGVVRGKASYMSPEQCLGDAVDLRTDIFALGIVLYELTTGARCFAGKTDFDRMLAVVKSEYHLPTSIVENYPPELEQIVRTALASDPADRYPSAAALLEALARVARGRGYVLGAAPVARLMKQLFGLCHSAPVLDDATPTAAMPAADVEVTARDVPAIDPAQLEAQIAARAHLPTASHPVARPRRFPHGTNSDCYVPILPDDALALARPTDDDDGPTRGRRPLPRRPSTPDFASRG